LFADANSTQLPIAKSVICERFLWLCLYQKGGCPRFRHRNEAFGAAVKMPLLVDGVAVGDTVAHSYILKQVTPGSHTITSKSENNATLTLSTEAGKNYYVWQEVKMGLLMARSKLSQVSEEEGKQGVMESKLVK
jgi:hypothetical protein